MANNTTKLTVAALDFDTIKNNLLTYLQSQDEFKDYKFTGSAINQLINILAYNTHYLAFYLNMVANEMFIDTAVLRQNIVSHAKLLGYTPRSATAAEAVVNVAITKAVSDPTTQLTLPAFTAFSSELLNGVSYNFVTLDSVTVPNVNNQFLFTDVVIREGQPVTKNYPFSSAANPTQIFNFGDSQIDTNTLSVIVQTSATNQSQNTYQFASNATEVNGESLVYYIDQDQNGNYEIYFGDGILGQALQDGNIVIVSYINTSGNAANELQNFQLQTTLLAGSTSNTTTVFPSSSGSPEESGPSIQFAAPKSYLAQNRAVTINDYINLINKNYPFFQAVTAWGGEQNVPPQFGQVFISAKPLNGFGITIAQQQFLITQILQPIGVLTVVPTFVNPDYNFLNYRINTFFNPTETSSTANQITQIVANAAYNWSNTNLNQFNATFKVSRLLRALDDADPSITGTSMDLFIEKRFDPVIDTPTTFILTFGTPLKVGIGSSRLYSSPAFQQLDSTGVLRNCFIEETPESSTGVDSVSITAPGSDYTTAPTLTIFGDGTGANAYAIIVNGQVQSVVVDKSGANYTTATILVTGGGGSGAILQPNVFGDSGTLRSFFFDQNNIKTILDANAGTIDYVGGVVTLKDFAPANVSNPEQVLSVHVMPQEESFGSNLNRILTFDTTDPGAISITLTVDTE